MGAVEDGEEKAVEFFNDWKDEVFKQVPADRLLVFDVREGWAPLCKFVDVTEPNVPFPNLNNTRHQQMKRIILKALTYVIWTGLAAGLTI